MSSSAKFISKKTPQEYIAEHYLSWRDDFSAGKRFRIRLKRRLSKFGVHLATCLLKKKQSPEKLNPDALSRVLVLRYDLLGDMILTTAVFDALKSVNPTVEIEVLASEKNERIIRGDKRLANIFLFSRRWSFVKIAFEMRRRNYDLVLSFNQVQSSMDALLSTMLAPNALKSSVKRTAKYRPYFDFIATESIGETHTVDKFLATIKNAVVAPISETTPSLALDDAATERITRWLNQKNISSFILVNLSAGQPYREWQPEKYVEWIRRTLKETLFTIVLLATEKKIIDAKFIESAIESEFVESSFAARRVFVFPPTQNVMDVASLIDAAAIVFTPDTAIVHLASARKRPVLGLYTIMGTIPQEWTPYRVPYRAVLADGHLPVSTISVDDVFGAFSELYQELQEQSFR
jgi:ADP-heptose:LPS heptosyltransferase